MASFSATMASNLSVVTSNLIVQALIFAIMVSFSTVMTSILAAVVPFYNVTTALS